MIRACSFEFGGCNLDSRTFLRDYFEFFSDHGMKLFRITPAATLVSLPLYRENLERFITTNYLAVGSDNRLCPELSTVSLSLCRSRPLLVLDLPVIEIKPTIEYQSVCPHCGSNLKALDIIWQGIHVCAESKCSVCHSQIIGDLPVGHGLLLPFQVDLAQSRLFGDLKLGHWFGQPLMDSLKSPEFDVDIPFRVERKKECKKVLILNCIDSFYGHCVLKLLNAERHLQQNPELGLVVIVPRFLRWMVSEGVAEIWTVDLPLARANRYHPKLARSINAECGRFDTIYLSRAYSHPRDFDITRFTRVKKHEFAKSAYRITYIWREDRLWWGHPFTLRVAGRLRLKRLFLPWQNLKIRRLFALLRREFPEATFTVAGLGRSTDFPDWIDDQRVEAFTDELERRACTIYADSRIVIGVHGSSMLLPSAHAGITIDLMPDEKWFNMAQDILYQANGQDEDERISAFRHQYFPASSSPRLLSRVSANVIKHFSLFRRVFDNNLTA